MSRGSRARRRFAVLLVAVGHDDGGVGGVDVGESGVEVADAGSAGEAFRASEVGAVVGDGEVPAEGPGKIRERQGVVAGAEDEHGGGRGDDFDEVLGDVRGLAGFERFAGEGGEVRVGTARVEGFFRGIKDERGAGGICRSAGYDYGGGAVLDAASEGLESLSRRLAAFEENKDGAAAAEAVGHVAIVIEETGVALKGGSLGGKPPGFSGDFGFEAAAADGSGALAR